MERFHDQQLIEFSIRLSQTNIFPQKLINGYCNKCRVGRHKQDIVLAFIVELILVSFFLLQSRILKQSSFDALALISQNFILMSYVVKKTS